jgi:hypothetical protein
LHAIGRIISHPILVSYRPHRKLGTIAGSNLFEDAIQVFLDRTFGQMEIVSNFFV